jgi:hypothetical protein
VHALSDMTTLAVPGQYVMVSIYALNNSVLSAIGELISMAPRIMQVTLIACVWSLVFATLFELVPLFLQSLNSILCVCV